MDRIKKLLSKIKRKDRERLLLLIENLFAKNAQKSKIKKIKNTDFYRIRSGRFRIIFHYEKKGKEIVIDSIKLRDEKTYK